MFFKRKAFQHRLGIIAMLDKGLFGQNRENKESYSIKASWRQKYRLQVLSLYYLG